jgi:hypothetical protein
MRWIFLAEDKGQWKALMNAGSIKCWEIIEYLDNWRYTEEDRETGMSPTLTCSFPCNVYVI